MSRRAPAAITLALLALLGACSGDDDVTSATRATTSSTTAVAAVDTTAMCDLFGSIATQAQMTGRRPGDAAATFTAEQWQVKIATTGKIVEVVPHDYEDEARTYLELVEARAGLARDHEYGPVPETDRSAFIAEHRDAQQESNRLIAYVTDTCDLPSLG
jgi:xanthosine utilization system XapX-like protein